MEFKLQPGDMVFLTQEYENFIRSRKRDIRIRYVNRIAKLEEIIDWDSEKGKRLKKAREMSGKWKELPIEDNRFIFSIYYPELIGRNNQQGVIERGVPFFSKNPENGKPFFIKAPLWLFQEMAKQCERFDIEWKNESELS